jgi:hypothetical protein
VATALLGLTAAPVHVQIQALMTLTAVLTHADAVAQHPRALSSLVGRLLELARQTNASPTRLLRGAACQCLQELEATWPGLLAERLPLLTTLAAEETTHVAQAYLALVAAVTRHAVVVVGAAALPKPLPAATAAAGTFVVPEHVRRPPGSAPTSAADKAGPVPAAWRQEAERAVSLVLDSAGALAPTALAAAVLALADAATAASLRLDGFRVRS